MIFKKKEKNTGSVITIDVDGEKYDFTLSEPTFEVKVKAIQKLITTGGDLNMVGAGQVIFDSCYQGTAEELIEIKENADAYISLCFKCAEYVKLYEAELKKK